MTEVTKMEPQTPTASEPQGGDMVSMIERLAMRPDVPIERLEQMLAMKERMEDRARQDEERRARKAFYADLAKAQAEIPVVLRNKKNTHTKSSYADLASIEHHAMPTIREHGFSVTANSIAGAEKGFQRVRLRVAHAEGHIEEVEDDFPLDGVGAQGAANKTALHAKGSTTTYARRYMVTSFFNIATADDDGNAGGKAPASTISQGQYEALRDLIDQAGTTDDKVCGMYGVQRLPDLPAVNFDGASGMLKQRINAKRKQAEGGA